VCLVSIVIPCYNVARYVRIAVQSVIDQEDHKIEIILIDDGSPDDIGSAIENLQDHPTLRYIRKSNGGVASARNEGFKFVSPQSEFVCFLDGDDFLKPGSLARMVEYFKIHPEVGMVHCIPETVDEDGKFLPSDLKVNRWAFGPRELPDEEPETPFESIYCLAWIIPSVCLIRTRILHSIGGYDEKIGHCMEDTDLYLRVALQVPVHFIPEKLACYRIHPGQVTADRKNLAIQEKKLYAKWSNLPMLSEAQLKLIQRCERFRTEELASILGFRSANRYWREGHLWLAMRFWQGAVKRRIAAIIATTS
jgi:glycosyltransferase involved in cell wall biosynthesis